MEYIFKITNSYISFTPFSYLNIVMKKSEKYIKMDKKKKKMFKNSYLKFNLNVFKTVEIIYLILNPFIFIFITLFEHIL